MATSSLSHGLALAIMSTREKCLPRPDLEPRLARASDWQRGGILKEEREREREREAIREEGREAAAARAKRNKETHHIRDPVGLFMCFVFPVHLNREQGPTSKQRRGP